MKLSKHIVVAALLAGSLLVGSSALQAQNAGGGGGGYGRGRSVLTQEQNQQIREALQATPELAELNRKLAAAQKEAVTAALAPDATEASIRDKIAAVNAIQTDIAVLRYTKAVKPVVASITDDQKTQINAAPAGTYAQFFGGGPAGFGGRRGGGGGGGGAPGGAPGGGTPPPQ